MGTCPDPGVSGDRSLYRAIQGLYRGLSGSTGRLWTGTYIGLYRYLCRNLYRAIQVSVQGCTGPVCREWLRHEHVQTFAWDL